MFSHVMVGSNDLDRSKAFYDKLLGVLGAGEPMRDKDRLFYMAGGRIFAVTKPINGEDACSANGGTIGFACDTPEKVDAWHAAGVAAGGTSIEDPPGMRQGPIGPLYLAYLRDPDGNKLCALHRAS